VNDLEVFLIPSQPRELLTHLAHLTIIHRSSASAGSELRAKPGDCSLHGEWVWTVLKLQWEGVVDPRGRRRHSERAGAARGRGGRRVGNSGELRVVREECRVWMGRGGSFNAPVKLNSVGEDEVTLVVSFGWIGWCLLFGFPVFEHFEIVVGEKVYEDAIRLLCETRRKHLHEDGELFKIASLTSDLLDVCEKDEA